MTCLGMASRQEERTTTGLCLAKDEAKDQGGGTMARVALCDVSGLLKDVLDKLSGEDGSRWGQAFKLTLRKENPWPTSDFPIFRTIQIGTHSFIGSLRRRVKKSGYVINRLGNDLLNIITLASTPTTLNLVVVSNADLGFSKGVNFEETCARAKERGLDYCPAEVGPQLFYQYLDQPMGESLFIAMKPIALNYPKDEENEPLVFVMERDHDGESRLGVCYGSPDSFLRSDTRFVFVFRRLI